MSYLIDIERIKLEMNTVEKWVISCTTKAQLKTCIEFFGKKQDEYHNQRFHSLTIDLNGALTVGNAIGRVIAVAEMKVAEIKKEQKKLAQ